MARIVKAELRLVDLKPMTQRTDAIYNGSSGQAIPAAIMSTHGG